MTTKPKHTPGPWRINDAGIKYDESGMYVDGLHVVDDVGAICTLTEYQAPLEAHANASLIAAAPDMYDALKERLLPMWESGIEEPWIKRARAAIAKAEGETP